MRAAFVSPAWPAATYPNGIVSYIANLRPALADLDVQSVVAAGRVADDSQSDSVADVRDHLSRNVFERLFDHLSRDHHGVGEIRRARGIVRAIRALETASDISARHIDVVEIEESFGLCRHVEAFGDWPTVVRLHGPWFLNGPALGVPRDAEFDRRVRDEGEALAHAHFVSAPSLDVLERTRTFYDLSLEDAVVIPNACPAVPVTSRWRQENADPDRVLFVGRFDLHKGGDIVIDAIARVLRSRPNTRLWFAGPDKGIPNGDRGSLDAPSYLARAIPDPRLRERVELLGPCDSQHLDRMRREAALTLVASRYENFPMTVLEALAYGSPLVATNVGGIAEIVRNGENGWLVPGDDLNALADGILQGLSSADEAQRISVNAAEDTLKRYSPGKVATQTRSFYTHLLG